MRLTSWSRKPRTFCVGLALLVACWLPAADALDAIDATSATQPSSGSSNSGERAPADDQVDTDLNALEDTLDEVAGSTSTRGGATLSETLAAVDAAAAACLIGGTPLCATAPAPWGVVSR